MFHSVSLHPFDHPPSLHVLTPARSKFILERSLKKDEQNIFRPKDIPFRTYDNLTLKKENKEKKKITVYPFFLQSLYFHGFRGLPSV